MVHRKVVALITGAALLLPAALHAAPWAFPEGRPTLEAAGAEASTPQVLVEWVIRTDDLVACRTAAPDLRRMRHEYQGQLRLVAYAVEADPSLVRSFLRRELLGRTEVQPITEREFQVAFGRQLGPRARTPALLVSRGGTRVAFEAGIRNAPGRRGVDEFSAYVDLLMNPALAANPRNPSASGGQ